MSILWIYRYGMPCPTLLTRAGHHGGPLFEAYIHEILICMYSFFTYFLCTEHPRVGWPRPYTRYRCRDAHPESCRSLECKAFCPMSIIAKVCAVITRLCLHASKDLTSPQLIDRYLLYIQYIQTLTRKIRHNKIINYIILINNNCAAIDFIYPTDSGTI